MGPFEYLGFLQNAYSISKSTFLEVDVGPLQISLIFIHWRNMASLGFHLFQVLIWIAVSKWWRPVQWPWGSGDAVGNVDSWILSRSSPWNDYQGWGQHSLHRHHRWGAGKRGCILWMLWAPKLFFKVELMNSWTLVEVDCSKWWLFQAFLHRFSKRSLRIKANQPHPATVHLCTSWCLVEFLSWHPIVLFSFDSNGYCFCLFYW